MRRSSHLLAVLAAAAQLATVTACGSSSKKTAAASIAAPTTTKAGRVLTPAQASRLARALLENYNAGGAEFDAVVVYGPAATFTYRGEIDWKTHLGHAVISAALSNGKPAPPTEIWFNRSAVISSLDGLEAEMAKAGRPGIKYVARQLTPKGGVFDATLALIDGLSSDRAENPLLIRQGRNLFLGPDPVDAALDQYRFGDKTRYSLGRTDGRVHRLVATFRAVAQPLMFTFRNHGPQNVKLPAQSSVVDVDAIPEVYQRLTHPAITTVPATTTAN